MLSRSCLKTLCKTMCRRAPALVWSLNVLMAVVLTVLVGVVVARLVWYKTPQMHERFAGTCASEHTPLGPPGTFVASALSETDPPSGCEAGPTSAQTIFTSKTHALQSHSTDCLAEAQLSVITQPNPLPPGAQVRAKLGDEYGLSSAKTGRYHTATVVQHLSRGDPLFGSDSMGSGIWNPGSQPSQLHTFNDPYDTKELLSTLSVASIPVSTTPYQTGELVSIDKYTGNPAAGVYPGVSGHAPSVGTQITTYTSPHDGYVLEFEDPDVQKAYEQHGSTNPMFRVVAATDVIPMPTRETVDTCASGCLHRTGFKATRVQVGGCEGGRCKCLCVPPVTDSTDSCAAALQPSLAHAPYNVYNIDTNVANQRLLMSRWEQSLARSGASQQKDTVATCSGHADGSSTSDASMGSCECQSACEAMNYGSAVRNGTHLCMSASELQDVLTSIPKPVVIGSMPSLRSCPSGRRSGSCLNERPTACPLQLDKDTCEANPRCEWTNRPYKYSSAAPDSTSGGNDPNCSTTETGDATRNHTMSVYKCVTKPLHTQPSAPKAKMYTVKPKSQRHAAAVGVPRLFASLTGTTSVNKLVPDGGVLPGVIH